MREHLRARDHKHDHAQMHTQIARTSHNNTPNDQMSLAAEYRAYVIASGDIHCARAGHRHNVMRSRGYFDRSSSVNVACEHVVSSKILRQAKVGDLENDMRYMRARAHTTRTHARTHTFAT
jgi:hypothetical protein